MAVLVRSGSNHCTAIVTGLEGISCIYDMYIYQKNYFTPILKSLPMILLCLRYIIVYAS